jgi:flagellar protein FlaI
MLRTKVDDIVGVIEQNKKISYSKIAKKLSIDEDSVEKVMLILEKAGLAETHYPLVHSPWAKILVAPDESDEEENEKKAIEKYDILGRGQLIKGTVRIVHSDNERRAVYKIALPHISPYTKAYLEYVKSEVSKSLPLEQIEKSKVDAKKNFELRHGMISERIERDISPDQDSLEILSGIVINEMFGLGELEALIGDDRLEEIVINSARQPISIYHRQYGWLKTNIYMDNETEIENFAEQIARKVGKQISTLNPILDAHLNSGDRANATLYPISTHGNTITLRLFARNPWTITKYLKANCLSLEMAALLWQGMHYEMNILIAGGTASGKTSTLNGLLGLIPPFQRIVTIEDTRELVLPSYQWNWVPMVTRQPNPEGFGEVTMLDLVVNALRMRPDRISMGEIRRKKEAEVLFEAMHTGHSVYSTIHADTGTQVIKRLTEPPIDIPTSEVEDIHLLLVQYRDRRKNIRRTLELSEVVPGIKGPELKRIYNWKPRTDSFQLVNPLRRYLEQMNLHTGMTEKEVKDDQKRKVSVLKWMMKHKLDSIEETGKVMKCYYTGEDDIVKAAEKGQKPSKVL